jgi:hypothetical protein
MHHNENDDTFNRADCVPAFFTIRDPLCERHTAGVIENEFCRFKVDTVLRPVDFVFRPVPFDPNQYLQFGTYDCVKSSGGVRDAKVTIGQISFFVA